MSTLLKSLGIDTLSTKEKVALIEELMGSICDAEFDAIDDQHHLDLTQRIQNYEVNPESASTWDEVKARLNNVR
jgi:putative addiction module component (TIGR02574 family)